MHVSALLLRSCNKPTPGTIFSAPENPLPTTPVVAARNRTALGVLGMRSIFKLLFSGIFHSRTLFVWIKNHKAPGNTFESV